MYTYQAKVLRVVDGDTLNARELTEPGGQEAREHLVSMLGMPPPHVVVESVKVDKFSGRFDAIVSIPGRTIDVGTIMVGDGYAARWDGTGPKPIPPWPIPHDAKG